MIILFFLKFSRSEDSFVEIWFSGSDASQLVIYKGGGQKS